MFVLAYGHESEVALPGWIVAWQDQTQMIPLRKFDSRAAAERALQDVLTGLPAVEMAARAYVE